MISDICRIEEWSLVHPGRLKGIVYGHKRMKDGEAVITSPILKLDIARRDVMTYSGTSYYLGEPDEKWLEFIKDNGMTEYFKEIQKYEENLN